MVVIVLNVFQRPFEPFNHFKKRVPSKSKSEFRETNFGIFMEQFKNVWTSLVSPHEIFARNLYLRLIIWPHLSFFLSSADAILTAVSDNCLASDKRRIISCYKRDCTCNI